MEYKSSITYSELVKAHKNKEIEFDKTYIELILPIKDAWTELDSIIDFVRIWNRRVPIGKNKEKIKQAVLSLKSKFKDLKDFDLETFDFSGKNVSTIKDIFDELYKIKLKSTKRTILLKSTGTSKLLHGINPRLFVMWDKGICEHYGCSQNSAGYILFLKMMKEEAISILKEKKKEYIEKQLQRTIPKLIDEYNWIHFRTSKNND